MKGSEEKKPRMKRETRNALIYLGIVSVATILIMFVFPLLAVRIVNGQQGMIIFMNLYFWANPICAAAVGIFTAWNVKKRWYLPFTQPVIYLLSSALLFESLDFSFFQSAFLYLLFSYMTMGIAFMLFSFRNRG